MRTITITAAERRSRTLDPASLRAALAALSDDGLVVLADAIDPDHVARLRDRLWADVPLVAGRADAPYNWNTANLQQSPPRDPEWLFPDVVANDQAVAVTHAMLGDGVANAFYSGNTAMPRATERQPVHVDTGHLWPAESGWAPPFSVVVNVPLVDMDASNGAIELWPGSHRDLTARWGQPLELPPEAVERRRAIAPPFQPEVRAGSILLRDMRLWHAGMPNRSDRPRPLLAMIHEAAWWSRGDSLDFPRAAQPGLAHPLLTWRARWVDEPVDHLRVDTGYKYVPEAAATT